MKYKEPGMVVNNWTLLHDSDKYPYWLCKCACGVVKQVDVNNILAGRSKSCGCIARNKPRVKKKKVNKKKPRIYRIWTNMKSRCKNTKMPAYTNYGGRGIEVCQEWEKFITFFTWAMSNGYTDTLTLERLDFNSGYTPENCAWVPKSQQSRNTRKQKNNKTGVTGVYKFKDKYYLSTWCENKINKSKTFTINKYGEEQAKQMAIDYRKKMILLLKEKGEIYGDNHGD